MAQPELHTTGQLMAQSNASEQLQELQALESIFSKDFSFLCSDMPEPSGEPKHLLALSEAEEPSLPVSKLHIHLEPAVTPLSIQVGLKYVSPSLVLFWS